MKIKLQLLVVCFFYTSCLNAQCYFHKIYRFLDVDTLSYDFGNSIISQQNILYTTGLVQYYANVNNFGTLTVGVNECGDTLWRKSYEYSSQGDESGQVILTINGSTLCIVGEAYDTTQNRREGFIMFIDTSGNVLSRKTLNAGARNEIVRGGILVNNEIIIGGYFNELMPDSNIFLMKTDIAGNIIWTKYHGIAGSTYSVLKNMDRAKDGGYILGGSVVRIVGSISYRNLYMTKTDIFGNKEWTQEYAAFYQGAVMADFDGNYVLVGNELPSPSDPNGYVGKMDSAGDVIWEKRFNQPDDPEVFTNVIQLPDSNYLIAGDVAIGSGAPAYIAKLSKNNGSIIWERTFSYYGGQTQNYIEDFIITPEGDIAATGYLIPISIPHSSGNDMFILKIDSCGYLENQNINATFSFSLDTINKTVLFTNQSTEYCTALWYFGDGDSTYQKNPTHTYSANGIYYVTLIVRAGNSLDTFQQQIVVLPVGINHQPVVSENVEFKLYPNPNNGRMTLEYTLKEKGQFVLYDIRGMVLKKIELDKGNHKLAIEENDLSSGIYLFRITDAKVNLHNDRIVIIR